LARAEELREENKQSLELRNQAITRLGDLLAKVGDRVLNDMEYEIISKMVHDLSYIPTDEEQRIAIVAAEKLVQSEDFYDESSYAGGRATENDLLVR